MSADSNGASVQSVVHTPGPWVVRKRNPPSHGYLFGFHVGNSEQRTTVCEVVNEHDAKLIAVAPEMLAVVKRFATIDWMGEAELNMWATKCQEIMRRVV